MRKNDQGFSVVEIIMAVVIVGLLGAVGWMYWNNVANKSADDNQAKASVTPKPSPSASTTPAVQTKAYTSEKIKLAFDYPAAWTLTDNKSNYNSDEGYGDDHQLLQSPGGFKLYFNTRTSNSGLGGTGPAPAVTNYKSYGSSKLDSAFVQAYTLSGSFSLYLSSNSSLDDYKNNHMYDFLIGITKPTTPPSPYSISFGSVPGIGFAGTAEYPVQQPSDKELSQAIDILKSLHRV